jgi:hypothetical protein
MTLDNLVGISLERITTDAVMIKRLLAAAERNLQDASIAELSNENRFDTAYKAIMQIANAALQARGYRTLTSKPGHHQAMLQSLSKTLGIESPQLIVLDALRKQRNVADYSGDLVTDTAVNECISQAHALWLLAQEQLSK